MVNIGYLNLNKSIIEILASVHAIASSGFELLKVM